MQFSSIHLSAGGADDRSKDSFLGDPKGSGRERYLAARANIGAV
jgi:hypothetical protein